MSKIFIYIPHQMATLGIISFWLFQEGGPCTIVENFEISIIIVERIVTRMFNYASSTTKSWERLDIVPETYAALRQIFLLVIRKSPYFTLAQVVLTQILDHNSSFLKKKFSFSLFTIINDYYKNLGINLFFIQMGNNRIFMIETRMF